MNIKQPSKLENFVVLGLSLASILIMLFFLYGIFACFWQVPHLKAKIHTLETKVELMSGQIDYLNSEIEKYRVANNFNDLFVMLANPNQMIDMSDLNKWLRDKREFYERKR